MRRCADCQVARYAGILPARLPDCQIPSQIKSDCLSDCQLCGGTNAQATDRLATRYTSRYAARQVDLQRDEQECKQRISRFGNRERSMSNASSSIFGISL